MCFAPRSADPVIGSVLNFLLPVAVAAAAALYSSCWACAFFFSFFLSPDEQGRPEAKGEQYSTVSSHWCERKHANASWLCGPGNRCFGPPRLTQTLVEYLSLIKRMADPGSVARTWIWASAGRSRTARSSSRRIGACGLCCARKARPCC